MKTMSANLKFFAAVMHVIDSNVEEAGRIYNSDQSNLSLVNGFYYAAAESGKEFIGANLPIHYEPFKEVVRGKMREISLAVGALQRRPLSSMLRRIA